MGIEHGSFAVSHPDSGQSEEISEVEGIAGRLLRGLELAAPAINKVHVHGAMSSSVQELVAHVLLGMGFREEIVLTPQEGLVTRARPDFVYRLREDRGIIAEVERGGTIANNYDLKDMWKAHLSPDSQHLFLVVPQANWNEGGGARERPFARVVQRMGSFFGDSRREVDVLSCHVFGYGTLESSQPRI